MEIDVELLRCSSSTIKAKLLLKRIAEARTL